jgi:hypothetical protein
MAGANFYDQVTREWVTKDELLNRRYERRNVDHRATNLACPTVFDPLPEYRSPVTGEVIDGRDARREDLKRNNCREVDPSEGRHREFNDPTAAALKGAALTTLQKEQVSDAPGSISGIQPGGPDTGALMGGSVDYTRSKPE